MIKRLFVAMFVFLLLVGCEQTKLTGKWRITKIDKANFKQFSAVPSLDNNEGRKPYDTTLLDNMGNLYYLALEEDAIIEFKANHEMHTTLFLANFGEKTYEYDPATEKLAIIFLHQFDDTVIPNEYEVYSGKFSLVDPSTANWHLDNGKIFTLERQDK